MGRITKLTPEVSKAITAHVSQGCPYRVAAEQAGIGAHTLMMWLKRGREGKKPYAEFNREIRQAKSAATVVAVRCIMQAGEKSWKASAWWLERQEPDKC